MSEFDVASCPSSDMVLTAPDPENNHQDRMSQLNEMGSRKTKDRRQAEIPVANERRKVTRRRRIDPTTCERDYSDSEIEFIQAMDDYKNASGRMFPTCSEILEVIIKLGYRQVAVDSPIN